METCPLFQWKLPTSKTTFSLSFTYRLLYTSGYYIFSRTEISCEILSWQPLKTWIPQPKKIKSIGFLLSLVTFQRPVRGSRERVPWLNPILPVSSSFCLFRQMQTHAIWSSCATWRTNDKLQNLRELFYLGNISFLIYIFFKQMFKLSFFFFFKGERWTSRPSRLSRFSSAQPDAIPSYLFQQKSHQQENTLRCHVHVITKPTVKALFFLLLIFLLK